MRSDDSDRLELVNLLLDAPDSLASTMERLSSYSWDFTGTGVQLKREHIEAALQRYLSGSLTREQLEDWANAIEGREDIEFDGSYGQLLADIVYELANPTLTQLLSKPRAIELIKRMDEG